MKHSSAVYAATSDRDMNNDNAANSTNAANVASAANAFFELGLDSVDSHEESSTIEQQYLDFINGPSNYSKATLT